MMKILEKIWESEIFRIIILATAIVNTILLYTIWDLYYPQATIVLHDYGQVFESEIDWKLWRLEHERN